MFQKVKRFNDHTFPDRALDTSTLQKWISCHLQEHRNLFPVNVCMQAYDFIWLQVKISE